MITMGLTFNNPNNLQQMLDKFATVPDPKKTPKRQGEGLDKPKKNGGQTPNVINEEKEPEVKSKKKKDKK